MPLTFQNLQDEASTPDDSFIVTGGKLFVDVGTLIGESVTSLASPKVAEFGIKFCQRGREAQQTYNDNSGAGRPSGQNIGTFSGETQGTPTVDTSGNIYSQISINISGLRPVDPDAVSDVMF